MGNDDVDVGEVNRHVFQQHGVAVLQTQATAAAHATAYARVTAVKDGRQLVFGNHLVQRPGHAVVGLKALHGRVKLEALHAVLFNQFAGFTRAHFSFVRIDAAKGNHDVGVGHRGLGDLFIRNATSALLAFSIDREHHKTNFLFAIVRQRLVHGGPLAAAKVFVCGAVKFFAVVVKRIATRHLQVGVHVDGDDVVGVHLLGSFLFADEAA